MLFSSSDILRAAYNLPYEIRATTDEECMGMAGRVLKRIARENVYVSLTLPASLPFNREFTPRSATQSVEKSDSVTPPLL